MFQKKSFAILLTCVTAGLFAQSNKTAYSLDFTPKKYTVQKLTVDGKSFTVRAYENIVYVKNPVDTAYEVMNIYVPEAYYKGKSINGYTSETAPIFFPNQVGGYMPAKPASSKNNGFGGMTPMGGMNGQRPQAMPPMGMNPGNGTPPVGMGGAGRSPMGGGFGKKESTVLAALAKGYVVASAGARGRTLQNANGIYTGKAPAGLVDLKAAVRYLKYNDKVIPGDANKIISNGTSAGGAMSALLGATGDNPDYLPYLKEIGAAETSDAIFASSDYCPITNLDHADAAYEWQFYGVNTYASHAFGPQQSSSPSKLSENQIKVSEDLKKQFPDYVNSLQLTSPNGETYTLDANGNGSFKDLVKSYVIASANKAVGSGADLTKLSWLTFANGKVVDLDWDAYVRYMERQKTPPAFDALDMSAPENSEFGTANINARHFTDYAQQNSTAANATQADQHTIKLMNPMYYIGAPNTKTAQHWRIRHGSKDKDTGLAISVILGTYLQNKGYDVNLELPWDKPHSGDYDLDELFQWIDGIAK